MTVGARKDPVMGYNFLITLFDSATAAGTIAIGLGLAPAAGFSECGGLEMTMQPEEYRQGGENDTVRKFAARVTWTNLRLRRGVAFSNDLWGWLYSYVQGRGKRRDGMITLRDDQQNAVRVWQFKRGLPIKWTGPAMNALQNQVALEELEIAHEGLKLVSTSGGKLVEAATAVAGAVGSLF